MVKRKLLLVEDNKEAAELAWLALENYDVHTVGTEAEGIAAIKADCEAYAVCVLDLILPNGNGVGVVRRFRAQCGCMPLVITTGLQDYEVEATEILKAGAQEILRKPWYTPQDLSDACTRAIIRMDIEPIQAKLDAGEERLKTGEALLQSTADSVHLPPKGG